MTLQTSVDRRAVLARIDAIMRELEGLRRLLDEPAESLVVTSTQPKTSMTATLWGAAGQGIREEYDLDLEWHRFGT